MTRAQTSQDATVATEPAWSRHGSWFGLPLLGGLAGWLVALVSGWVAGLSWAPFQGPFTFIASLPQPQGTLGVVGFGVVAGIGFASYTAGDRLAVTVTPQHVMLRRGRRTARTVQREQVDAVFTEGGALVLLDDAGDELAHESTGVPTGVLEEAFRAHGYQWHEDDPHVDEYREWVADAADVPVRANSLLRTRKRALAKRRRAEAAHLRAELARAGVLVRDRERRQYWRPRPHRDDD